ncbi:deoxyguanosinetriphosphate triphosphohydrolase [uncultured Desulfuromonas sp.]|uniref:deoxyguanosinetriphosphate triphosphohydrolase n=1 Tax=uncultured Desulfuromonas sp. TaxID=181013 RepID=UPI002AAAAA18|nr:deoxyguanosinetriphosphate triphosphohydrolase [uncultured Desulfuromonas sp.]
MPSNAIRHMIEQREKNTLSPFACCSADSLGRETKEQPCPIRTCFQHDRDRILHCKSFRRLKHKTQVFLSPEGDHYRTRLTHTLEVSQIARTVARALSLNEDLTEAITLGHDLGHTPFGHAGERVLNELLGGGFHHVRQSVRVVERLEKNGRGLNLTSEVRDGILYHSKGTGPVAACCDGGRAKTLEGQIVRFADIIAYVNHDLDDALRSGVITVDDVPKSLLMHLGQRHSQRINTMVSDMIQTSQRDDAIEIGLSDNVLEWVTDLRDWLFDHVYRVPSVHDDFTKAARVLRELFEFFMENPDQMERYGAVFLDDDPLEVSVTDFIAGMTDRYAMKLYQEIFLPRPWATL